MSKKGVVIGLSAVIVSSLDADPKVFVVRDADHGDVVGMAQPEQNAAQFDALPFGAFDPSEHDTLELGLREWVENQTPLTPGYVEQLYTFGNRGRYLGQEQDGARVISVGYLALTRYMDRLDIRQDDKMSWASWYDFFPWEDWRGEKPEMIDGFIIPNLKKWAKASDSKEQEKARLNRINLCFGEGHSQWDDEKVLERYELLYTARMVEEACRDKGLDTKGYDVVESRSMKFDHRRILATAIGRLRGKIKYRPVVFETMPESFTLLELQNTVEGLGGHNLHKQNFRRLVENSGMVEETGESTKRGGGRPASLYKFRESVMLERTAPGVRLSPAGATSR